MHIEKGVYGLKQAIVIANQDLVKHMATFRYHPVQHTHVGYGSMTTDTPFLTLWLKNHFVQYSSTGGVNHFLMPSEPNILSQSIWNWRSTLELI